MTCTRSQRGMRYASIKHRFLGLEHGDLPYIKQIQKVPEATQNTRATLIQSICEMGIDMPGVPSHTLT